MPNRQRSTRTLPARVVGLALGSGLLFAPAAAAAPLAARTITLTNTTTIAPHEAPARAWMPIPLESPVQHVAALRIEAPGAWTVERDTLHGNRYLYCELPPTTSPVRIQWTAKVTRHAWRGPMDEPLTPEQLAEYRRSLPLVPVGGPVLGPRVRLAVGAGAGSPTDRGRRLFQYVLDEMSYDKSGDGWGRGDALYACNVKTGNCTDFHALFNGLARTAGLAARFTMGLTVPETAGGTIGGYHCWTAVWADGQGWIPMDISEADKHPDRPAGDYYARLDPNRVALTRGRDLVLAPPQAGPRLNYAFGPYVEMDGTPVALATMELTFHDR